MRNILKKANNPISLAKEMMGGKDHQDWVMHERLRGGSWITVWSVEQILINRILGHCNYVYLRVCFCGSSK
jgi:hypothetical protein